MTDIITRLALGFGSLIACLLLTSGQQIDQSERLIGVVKDDAVIQLPAEIVLTSPLRLQDVDRVTLKGPTTIRYRGPATPGAIILARCGYCTIKDVKIVVESEGVGAAVLQTNLPGTSPAGRISTKNTFERVEVLSTPTPAKYAFSVDSKALGGADANNEFHRFANCSARGFRIAAYHVLAGQGHQLVYDGCSCDGIDSKAPNGWHFEYGVNAEIRNCNANRVKTCVRAGGFHMRLIIDGLNSELCTELARCISDGNSAPTSIKNCRWDGFPERDGHVVYCFTMGPVRVEDCAFTSLNGVIPKIEANCYQHQQHGVVTYRQLGHASINGNVFQVTNASAAELNREIVRVPASWKHSAIAGNTLIPWTMDAIGNTRAGLEQFAKTGRIP